MNELKNPYEGWMHGCWLVLGISFVVIVAGLGLGKSPGLSGSAKTVALVVGIIGFSFFLLFLVMLPVTYFMGRSALKAIRELVVEGNHWAHWQYGQEEWLRFAESEWTRTRGKARTLPVKVFVISLVCGLLLSFTGKGLSATNGLLFGGTLGIPIGILVGALTYLLGKATYKKRLANVGEVYIGPKGVYQHGDYTALKGFGLSLEKVEIQPGDPPVLHFEVKDSRGRRTTTTEVRVAVPHGHEQEAAALAQRFTAQT